MLVAIEASKIPATWCGCRSVTECLELATPDEAGLIRVTITETGQAKYTALTKHQRARPARD